jgi:hypothetical protein
MQLLCSIALHATWVPVSGVLQFEEKNLRNQMVYLSFDSTQFRPLDSILTDQKGRFGFFFYTFTYKGTFILSFKDCNHQRRDTIINYDISKYSYTDLTVRYCRPKTFEKHLCGMVHTIADVPISDALVRVFAYNFVRRQLEWYKDIKTDKFGIYHLPNAEVGLYMLRVIPPESMRAFYAPSYYPNATYWEEAEVIEKAEGRQQIAHFRLKAIRPRVGNSEIKGKVVGKKEDGMAPYAGLPVMLLDERKEIAQAICTDSLGYFYFENLEKGRYIIWVDQPGIPTDAPIVEAIDSVGASNEILITYNRAGISYDRFTGTNETVSNTGIQVYPNPAEQYIYFNNIPEITIEVLSASGQVLVQKEVSAKNPYIFVGHLPKGFYIIRGIHRDYKQVFIKK